MNCTDFWMCLCYLPFAILRCCYKPPKIKRQPANNETSVCFLLCVLPLLPFIWLYYIVCRGLQRQPHEFEMEGCCVVARPNTQALAPRVYKESASSNEGMSWYLHSYAACFSKFGCIKFLFTKDMSVAESIDRYVEAPRKEWSDLLRDIENNVCLHYLLEYLNTQKPNFYFRILPAGSVREGFGYAVPSTSILASDYDLMLVPDGVFVYDEFTERQDGYPASFTAIDDPNQNPERPKGFLWLRAEQNMEIWRSLCYERLTAGGGNHLFYNITSKLYLKVRKSLRRITKHIKMLLTPFGFFFAPSQTGFSFQNVIKDISMSN